MATTLTSSPSSSSNLIHNLFRFHKPPSSSISLFLKPISVSSSISQSNLRNDARFRSFFTSSSISSIFVAKSFSSPDLAQDEEEGNDEEDFSNEDDYSEEEEDEDEDEEVRLDGTTLSMGGIEEDSEESGEISEIGLEVKEEKPTKKKAQSSSLKLSIKEKKELASYAHSLGDKLKCQLVGKSGVTDSVVFSFLETLEKNELLKVKIRKTSPEELEDAVQRLEEATGSVAVGQIGRTVILYRPSLTKMKAEEKKKQVQRLTERRRQKFVPRRPDARREYSPRPDSRGRRGGSRVTSS